jgi:hypothetical protein
MTDSFAIADHSPKLGDLLSSETRLLVVTTGEIDAFDALGLPFRDATVIAADKLADLAELEPFDAVAIGFDDSDPLRIERLLAALQPRLRRGAIVLVALGGSAGDVAFDDSESPTLLGLEWNGAFLLGGGTYAILRATDTEPGPVSTGALLVAAHAAAKVAITGATRELLPAREVRRLIVAAEEDRRRSEHALLAHLANAVAHSGRLSAELRKRPKPGSAAAVKDLLRASRSGRLLLRVLGKGKRLLRGARRPSA